MMAYTTIAAANDPWQPYGQGKGKGVVPESGVYGAWLIGLVLIFVGLARLDNRKK